MAITYAIYINKGGQLKTASTTNISAALAKYKRKRVLIIDCDPQGTSGSTFGYIWTAEDRGLYHVLSNQISVQDIRRTVWQSEDGNGHIDLIPSGLSLADLERPSPTIIREKIIQPLQDQYDYIIIDTQPSVGPLSTAILVSSDYVLIPMTMEPASVTALIQSIDLIRNVQKEHHSGLQISGVFVTLLENIAHQKEIMQDTAEFLVEQGIYLYTTFIPRSSKFSASVHQSALPALLHPKLSKIDAVQSYVALTLEVF